MIGQRIKEIRTSNNLTQQELAEGIISRTYLSLIEKGSVKPSKGVLVKLSKKLNCSVNEFFTSTSTYQLNEMEILKDLSFYEQQVHTKEYHVFDSFLNKNLLEVSDVPNFDRGRIHLLYAKYYLHEKKLAKANEHVDVSYNLLHHSNVSKQYLDAAIIKSQLFKHNKEFMSSLDILEDVYFKLNYTNGFDIEKAKVLFYIAENYYELNQTLTALRILERLMKYLNAIEVELGSLNVSLLKAKNLIKLESFEEVIQLSSIDADTKILIAYAHYKLGDIRRAKSEISQLEENKFNDDLIQNYYMLLTERLNNI